jgi:hypothetical protein
MRDRLCRDLVNGSNAAFVFVNSLSRGALSGEAGSCADYLIDTAFQQEITRDQKSFSSFESRLLIERSTI